jgi:hypothetical protein
MGKIKGWKFIGRGRQTPGSALQLEWHSKRGTVILIDKNARLEISTAKGDIIQKKFGTQKLAKSFAVRHMRRMPNG